MNTLPQSKSASVPAWVPPASLALLAIALIVSGERQEPAQEAARPRTFQPRDFQSEWRHKPDVDLVRTLAATQVPDCSEFVFRPHKFQHGHYLVYCTNDGRQWTAWLVTTGTRRVVGPFPPDPLLALPQ